MDSGVWRAQPSCRSYFIGRRSWPLRLQRPLAGVIMQGAIRLTTCRADWRLAIVRTQRPGLSAPASKTYGRRRRRARPGRWA